MKIIPIPQLHFQLIYTFMPYGILKPKSLTRQLLKLQPNFFQNLSFFLFPLASMASYTHFSNWVSLVWIRTDWFSIGRPEFLLAHEHDRDDVGLLK